MSDSSPVHPSHNLQVMIFLLLLLPSLACQALAPSTPSSPPETDEGIHVSYPTSIETVRFNSGVIVAADHEGSYAMGFPKQWEVGAFHKDFVPTVAKHCETYGAICTLFQAIYEKDSSARIFAIDTSPEHLTKDSMATLTVGMFQDERHSQPIENLAAEYKAYLESTGQMKVTKVVGGTSNYGIPFAVLLSEPVTITDKSAYNATVLATTDKVYLEMTYTTADASIDRVNEILPMLSTLKANIE